MKAGGIERQRRIIVLHSNPQLNRTTYYSLESNRAYMSGSQFKSFQRCEAAGNQYAKDPTIETADAFYEAVYSVPRREQVLSRL